MERAPLNFSVGTLGPCRRNSPFAGPFVDDDQHVLYESELGPIRAALEKGLAPLRFELAGPRRKLFFDPSRLKCGVVTCGGLCPGLNDVIRAIVLSLHHHYGVNRVLGFRYGYGGMVDGTSHPPVELNPKVVEDIHQKGGTILGSSRGPQDPARLVDTLERLGIGILFAVGGDGTLRGAQAITEEVARRGRPIAVVGIPKTIDNDIQFVRQSFGFDTAVTETRASIYSAHSEAVGAENGVGLVKLMGRHSGFIAAYATLANSDVNFCLVPEVSFSLEGFLGALEARLSRRAHAVVVVAEGAGQHLMASTGERDASGNVRLGDIGTFLRDEVIRHFRAKGLEINLKYIDPSYTIRSMPANARDSAFCLFLGHHAVHAGMAGRTGLVIGLWGHEFTHVPIAMAVSSRKQINPGGRLWGTVVATTGQPRNM